jgi:uncharacterized coiled-coil protein SlyX
MRDLNKCELKKFFIAKTKKTQRKIQSNLRDLTERISQLDKTGLAV